MPWQLGIVSDDSNDDGEEQSDRGGTVLTGRATYLPYWDEPSDGCYYMHVGADFSHRQMGKGFTRYGCWPGIRPGSFDNIVWPRWAGTGNIAANDVRAEPSA